jgi:hypothetical protein
MRLLAPFKALCLQEEIYKLQEKLKLKQKQLEDENRISKLIISRNEIVDIFESVVPKDVAMKISSYHRHPIDEFIGSKNLRDKKCILSVFSKTTYAVGFDLLVLHWRNVVGERNKSQYLNTKDEVRRRTNYNLSTASRLRLFYPFTYRNIKQYTKEEIKYIAEENGIKLYMSWKKDKMIEEFYKRSN